MDFIKNKLSLVPNEPGCYLMKNEVGTIIYVGKAKKLKNRLSSYFRGTHTGKTAKLVSEIRDFEYIIVSSETESLILEINLIKKYDPKYNILLRDDKSYPYIEFTNEKAPRLKIVRNLSRKKNKNARLFGPYPNVTAARSTVNLINRLYPLRKCETYPKKPCLFYHIHECLGYCVYDVPEHKIQKMENDIIKFLKGDDKIITDKIKEEMNAASANLNFEKALELKNLLENIEITLVKQKVEVSDLVDRDVFGYYVDKGYLSIQVFFIRGAKIVGRKSDIFPMIDTLENEFLRYIVSFYDKHALLPKEVLIPNIVDVNILEEIYSSSFKIPQKGEKKKIVDMAIDNAKNAMEEKFELIKKDEARTIDANESLREILHLKQLHRIELFDNSNLFGSYNVSGMVVFKEGKPSKNDYRKFKITLDKNDDYGTMKEVIYRRYFRVLMDNLERPDLIIVDGAKGQMNIAREVLQELGMNIPVVGLKKDDKHSTNALLAFDPIIEIEIDKRSNLFYLLERMQDEVHNFTISYHRKLRSKGSIESLLDSIEGIGDKRKKLLLKKYHTINKIKEANIEELKEILPENVSIKLKEFLNQVSD